MKCYHHIDTDAVGVCTVCGRPVCEECTGIESDAGTCPECSGTFTPPPSPEKPAQAEAEKPGKRKSPAAACFMSMIIPGLGQLYSGQHLKALVFFVLFVYFTQNVGIADYLGLLLPVFYIYQIVDAVRSAKRYGRKEETEAEEVLCCPAIGSENGRRTDSAFWAWFLIIVGVIFQLNTLHLLPFAILPKLIPIVLIIIGLKLISGSSRHRREKPRHSGGYRKTHEKE
ncbi:LiaI-LiaF-like domain-containing protein [Acidobacteriota bacterium]